MAKKPERSNKMNHRKSSFASDDSLNSNEEHKVSGLGRSKSQNVFNPEKLNHDRKNVSQSFANNCYKTVLFEKENKIINGYKILNYLG